MSGGDAPVLSDLDDVGVALVRLDDTGVVTFLGGSWRSLWGEDGDDALGQHIWKVAAEPHRAALERSIRELLTGERERVRCEFELASEGATSRWVELRLRAARAPSRGVAVVGALWGIGERKQRERDSLRRKEQQAHLLRWAVRLQQVETMEQLLEAARIEVRERVGYDDAWLFMLRGEGDDRYGELVAHSGSHREGVASDVRMLPIKGDAMLEELVRGHGPVVVADARTDPRTNKNLVDAIGSRTLVNVPLLLVDELLGSFGTGTYADVGPQPPTDEQLEYLVAMARHLAVVVARIRFVDQERETQDLRERVLQSERLDSLGVLAGGVAHDFNNMLAVVLANAQLANRKLPKDSPVRLYINDLQTAAARAAKLSEQIRAFSGRADSDTEPVDLADVVAETVELVRGASEHGANIVFRRPHEVAVIEANRAQMQQVVMNLLANATEAQLGSPRPIAVELRRRRLDIATPHLMEGDYVELSVRDSGPGIPASVAPRVFEPFFTTKRNARGLGMAVVKGLVNAHRGHVAFESVATGGTEFTVLLPRIDAVVPETVTPSDTRAYHIPGAVLVVDDEASIRDSTSVMLEERGCRVMTASDGAAAVDMVRDEARDISIVLLDLRMPTLDGRDAFAELRRTHPVLPVLFTSGFPVDDVRSLLGSDPRVDFVQKPYDADVLVGRLRRLARTSQVAVHDPAPQRHAPTR